MKARTAILSSALLVLAACANKPTGGAASTASASATTSAAPVKASAAPTATAATATASASASAAPSAAPADSASAEAEPTGPVHIHMDSVKVTSGKSDGAEKTLKHDMLKLRTTCVGPALKKTPSFEGTLKVTLDVGADGKIEKAAAKAATGKLPADLLQCVEKFYPEKVHLDASKAQIEATILVGPKVTTKK